jgi:rSAM/selenodomain-associated transferase 1
MAAKRPEPVAIAVLAKAPIPGLAKTRLVPALGIDGAARLQARLIERAVETACRAGIGPVTVWATPDASHPAFQALHARFVLAFSRQRDGDLGARMLAAMAAAGGPALVIGSDCPALTPDHLHRAADVLRRAAEVVVFPAEDGGYVLIGARKPLPALFSDMRWGTNLVMAETRRRLMTLGLAWCEPATLWDVDVPDDLARMRLAGMDDLIPGG